MKLEDLVDQLGQDAIEMKKIDEEDRQLRKEEHNAMKKEKAQVLFEIKDEIDTVLSNPNFIT